MKFLKLSALVLSAGLLVACGGGGGSPGSVPGSNTTPGGTNPGGGNATPGGSDPGSSTPTPVATPKLTLSLRNSAGAVVHSISLAGGFVARAELKDAKGVAVKNKAVTFALSGAGPSIASLSPTTGMTGNDGVAEVAIAPLSVSSIGAGTVTASADMGGVATTGALDFSVQATSLSLSPLAVGNGNLPSGGNTSLKITALIGGSPASGTPVNVSFTASCGKINGQGTSSGVSVTTDGAGVAAATYDAVAADGNLCSGPVTLTAASAGATAQTATLTVAAPTANAISFVQPEQPQIFIAGSGAVDQVVAKFKVKSSAGTDMANVPVKFSIVTNPGGVGLGATNSTTPVTANSDSNGTASVTIFSGTIPGPVKVRAELVSDSKVFAESQYLTVASGPPSQKFMSAAVGTFNIEGWAIDGTSTPVKVLIADRQGNAVQNGTVINFTAEGGQIARSCVTTLVNGMSQCEVTFQSQNPRPAGGRVSILAYMEGTKDYIDVNSNNRFDPGVDTLLNIGDAYRDDNENGLFDPANGEFLIPRHGTSACPGSGEPYPAVNNTCDNKLATTVRQQVVIMLSSTEPAILNFALSGTAAGKDKDGKAVTLITGVGFRMASRDNWNLPMPSGTKVSVSALDSNPDDGLGCSVSAMFGDETVPSIAPGTNPNADLSRPYGVALSKCRAGDTVLVEVKAPSGLITKVGFTL